MEIYVFSPTLDMLGFVEVFESLQWVLKYADSGNFTLRVPVIKGNDDILQLGNIVWKNDCTECAVIDNIQYESDETGAEYKTVSGLFASGLLERRIVWGTQIFNGDISSCVSLLLQSQIINPTNPDRIIPYFSYSPINMSVPIKTQCTGKNVLAVIREWCETAEIGFRTVFDMGNKNINFELYKGVETPCVFGKEYENVLTQNFYDSRAEFSSVALVAGEGDGGSRTTITVGTGKGTERREIFVDARDLQSADFGEDYDSALYFRGEQKLAEFPEIITFDSIINTHGNLKYKVDFNLGDMVTIGAKNWGVLLKTRITEIIESYDSVGETIEITFGHGFLTISEKLKKR